MNLIKGTRSWCSPDDYAAAGVAGVGATATGSGAFGAAFGAPPAGAAPSVSST
jgi:hypothetical protein